MADDENSILTFRFSEAILDVVVLHHPVCLGDSRGDSPTPKRNFFLTRIKYPTALVWTGRGDSPTRQRLSHCGAIVRAASPLVRMDFLLEFSHVLFLTLDGGFSLEMSTFVDEQNLKIMDEYDYTIRTDHEAVKTLQKVVRYFNKFDEVRNNPLTAHFLNLITSVQYYIDPEAKPNEIDKEIQREELKK